MNWWKGLEAKVRTQEPLKEKTTFRIGGPAQFFCEPKDVFSLSSVVAAAEKNKVPIFILGAGSNILVSDKGVKGLVLRLNSVYFKRIFPQGAYINAGSGLILKDLIQAAAGLNMGGLEFLAGIPGTIGGAVAGNAGAWGRNIGELVEEVKIMDYRGRVKILGKKDIRFQYRSSSLTNCIILEACMKLKESSKEKIKENIRNYLSRRIDTQDISAPSAGCIFKNLSGRPAAGRLIDLCKLKGTRQADALVSLRHANFILNLKKATSNDVLSLMDVIRRRVKDRFNLNLEPEIKIWL